MRIHNALENNAAVYAKTSANTLQTLLCFVVCMVKRGTGQGRNDFGSKKPTTTSTTMKNNNVNSNTNNSKNNKKNSTNSKKNTQNKKK